MIEVERDEFRAWLEAKQPDDIVGTVAQHESCPVAMFLHYKYKPESGYVSVTGYGLTVGTEHQDAEEWVDLFIEYVDGTVDDDADVGMPVYAYEALGILITIEQDIREAEEWSSVYMDVLDDEV